MPADPPADVPADMPADLPVQTLADAAFEAFDDPIETRTGSVDAVRHGERLDKALVVLAPEFSRSHLQSLLARGHVRLDGQTAASASRRVRAGQVLAIDLVPTDESLAFRPQAMDLAVLYEDEHLLVIDKPAGLVVHPAAGNWSGTLLNALLARDAAAALLPRAGIVHRLDKDTSGVMMVGKSLPAVTALSRAIASREVHRRYLAIAHGTPPSVHMQIDAPIGRDPLVRVRMAVVAGGRPSRTDVERIAVRDSHSALRCTLYSALRCTLHSGRTHQIRVHLASRGLPLVGDVLYGGRPGLGLLRQALHATSLALAHPTTREPLHFDCPPPADFAAAWQQIVG